MKLPKIFGKTIKQVPISSGAVLIESIRIMASSSSIFTAVTDNEDSNRVVIKNERKSRVMDVVLGRGGFVGAYFVSVMAKWCDTYSSTKANQKNALIKEIVSELLENGCRFLDWEKKKTSWSFSSKPNRLVVVQCKSRISNKIKRYLREMSRERHSYEMKLRAKQQQQLQHAHRQQQPFLFTENYDVVASSSANQNAKKKKRKPNSAAFPLPSLQPTVMAPSLESSSSNTKKTSSNEEFCHRPPKKWKAATTESHATPSYSSIANSDKIKQDTRSLNAHTHCLEATTGIPIAPYPAIDNTNRTTELLLPKLYNSGNNSGQQWIVGTMTAAKSPSLSRTTALEPKTEEQSGNGDQEEIAMPPLPAAMQEQQQERHQQQQPRRSSIATVASASSLTRPPVFLTCDSGSLSVNPQFLADLKFLTPLQSPDIEEQQRPERNYPGAEASWETTRDDWVNSSSPSTSSDKDTNKDDDINNISTIHNTNIVATNKHHHNVLSHDKMQCVFREKKTIPIVIIFLKIDRQKRRTVHASFLARFKKCLLDSHLFLDIHVIIVQRRSRR